MERLTPVADPSGPPASRVAFYFLEALWAKSSGTGLTRWTLPLLSPLQVRNTHTKRLGCKVQGLGLSI